MIARVEPADRALRSPLGRVSPLLKLAVAVGWLVALATTTNVAPALAIAAVALVLAATVGRVPPGRLARGVLPLWGVAVSVGAFNALFSAANTDPAAAELLRLGPLRLTEPAVAAGIGVAARVIAIASIGVAFAQTTDSTRLVDLLVQQAGVSPRFAYGALAAYQAVPRFGEDLTTLRERAPHPRPCRELASAPARRAAGPRHPPRRPPCAGHGRPRIRERAAHAVSRGPVDVAGRGRGNRRHRRGGRGTHGVRLTAGEPSESGGRGGRSVAGYHGGWW